MNRRELFYSPLLCSAFAVPARPATAPDIPAFPGTRFRPYYRCLPEYLARLAAQAVKEREKALAKLTSATAIGERQAWVRSTLWKLIGGMPERSPLNARVTGTVERDRYRVDRIVYESRPGTFIPANLYVPRAGSGPHPAVLFQSGHYWEGKAYPSYQRFCQGLAQLGFVVLAFDPMGQGERIQYLDASGRGSRMPDCDSEHTMPGKQMILAGDSATRYQLWDAVRSLDYLASLPMVDGRRIASAGHSGGGTLTMLLGAADERLAAAAVSMGNAENVAAMPFLPPGATDDAEQNLIGSGPLGFDRWDLFYPMAPKPMMYLPSDRDFLATYSSQYIRNGWEEFQKLKSVYQRLNHAERLAWGDTPLPHALAYDSRMAFYNWFLRWLKPGEAPVKEEPPVHAEPEEALWATESGSVVRSLGSATAFGLIQNRKVERTAAKLESLVKISRPATPAAARTIGRTRCSHVRVEALEVPSGPDVTLPAFLLVADKTAVGLPVILVLDESECTRLWFHPEVDHVLGEDAPIVCAADVRGVGVLAPEFSPGIAGYAAWHQQEENFAWASLILGKPLAGQRAGDILALVEALGRHPLTAGRAIRVAASGRLTVPALFAASIEPRIERLFLSGGLVSFENLMATEVYQHPFANFVPGLLNHTDLPQLAASLAPRRLTLAGAVDAAGAPVGAAALETIYAEARRAGSLEILESPAWSPKELIAHLLA